MSCLENAILIAVEAHRGQVDKAGEPYVLHPLRVMMSLGSKEEKIVGVLHDVVEDTSVTVDDLRAAGFAEIIVAAIDSVTKRENEPYMDFILRAAANPIGKNVKVADLIDNMDLFRIARPGKRDFERIEKYKRALELMAASS